MKNRILIVVPVIAMFTGVAHAQTYHGIDLTNTVAHPALLYDTDSGSSFGLAIDDGDLAAFTGQSKFSGITFDLQFTSGGELDSRANIRNTGSLTLVDGSVVGPTANGNIVVNEGSFTISFSQPVLFFMSGNTVITEGEVFSFGGPGFLENRSGIWDSGLIVGANSVNNPSGSGNGTLLSEAHSFGFAEGTSWTFQVSDDFANDNRANYWFYVAEPVPEPSSTALLGLGFLGFIVRRKR